MKKKKILVATLAVCMAVSFTACAGKEKTPEEKFSDTVNSTYGALNSLASDYVSLNSPDISSNEPSEVPDENNTPSVEELLKNKQELKYSTTEGDFEYNIYDGYATITGYIGKSEHITVPSTIDNIPILVIGSHTFTDNYDVKTITISDGIMVISDATRSGLGFASPFARCGSLENIELPDSLKYIGSCAFYACYALTKIDIPEEVETIGSSAFWGCTSLKEVNLSHNLKTINDRAFQKCKALTKLTIPNNVITLGSFFIAGTSIQSITIPEKVENIEQYTLVFSDFDNNSKEIKVLNPNMSFQYEEDDVYISENTILYGFKNSTTEKYCKEHGNTFKLIEE